MNIGSVLLASLTLTATALGDAPIDWEAIAKDAEPALVTFTTGKAGAREAFAGFFVSKEGHALCDLKALLGKTLPTEGRTGTGQAVSAKSITAVFPEFDLALLQLDRQPDKWLTLSDQALPIGSAVAFLGPGQIPPYHTGPVVARYRSRSAHIDKSFIPVLSIAAPPPRVGRDNLESLRGGLPLIDPQGRVRGVFTGIVPNSLQTFILASPLDGLSEKVTQAIKAPHKIKLPLSAELNPYDPATRDREYTLATANMLDGETGQALANIAQLLKTHPSSRSVRSLQFSILNRAGRMVELRDLLQELSKPGTSPALDPIDLLSQRGQLEMTNLEIDTAIATFKELDKLAPPDYVNPKILLGGLYRIKGNHLGNRADYLEAEKWYKAAIALHPESMGLLSGYEAVLTKLNRWDEIDALSKRIDELETLYRRR
jgi:tetratricopeptide (TPR) repeat protein